MKITICGSIAFIDEMQILKNKLENLGHEVEIPPLEIIDGSGEKMSVKEFYSIRKKSDETIKWIWDRKEQAIKDHFKKVKWADAILVLNNDKNGILNYIGGNTFLEIGIAFYCNKKIFLFHPIPEISYKEEILGMSPMVINEDLSLIV